MDCGPACLRMIASYHGKEYTLQELRDKCYIDKEGVSPENPANRPDVLVWKDWLESITTSSQPDSMHVGPPEGLVLGELHAGYTIIRQHYQEWLRMLTDQSLTEKVKANQAEIKTIGTLMASLQHQISIYDQELDYQHKSLDRDAVLYTDKVISASDHEKSTAAYLTASRQRESMSSGILTHQMRVDQLQSQIIDLQISHESQLSTLYSTLLTQCLETLAAIGAWEKEYVIKAKIDGIVSIPGKLLTHTYVNAGEPLMSILPAEGGSGLFGLATVPTAGLGKIEPGDRVIIRLDAWPYKQYGSLTSKVEAISQLPVPGEEEHRAHELKMLLDVPVQTTMGTSLRLRPQETGRARIITRDRRILERLFDQIIQLTHINP